MPLTIACTCGQYYSVDEQYAGQQVPCSRCGRIITIPPPLPARGPYLAEPAEEYPAPRSGAGGAVAALLATVLFILVIGGGLAGVVWWLANKEIAKQAALDEKPREKEPEKEKETPAEPPRPAPPVKKEEDDKPPDKDKDKDKDKDRDKDKEKDKDKRVVETKDEPKDEPRTKLAAPTGQPWKGHEAAVLAVAIDRAGKHVWT